MVATIMDGRMIAREIKRRVKLEVGRLLESSVTPCLTTVLVGQNPASRGYLKHIHTNCAEMGIHSRNIELPEEVEEQELKRLIGELNADPTVHGVVVQLPLPQKFDEASVIEAVRPDKDVDGLHPLNAGQLFQGTAKFVACTPKAVMVMLSYYGIGVAGKHAVIINRSNLIGRPLSQLLLNADATVTVCHSKTRELKSIASAADILITAIGRRDTLTVTADMIKPEAVVVDIGLSVIGGKFYGDVDFEGALAKASYLTPVPGGVGPMTIAMLLYNTLLAAGRQSGLVAGFDLVELRAPAGKG